MNEKFKYDRKDMLNPILKILKKSNSPLSVKQLDEILINEMDISESQARIIHNEKSARKRTELNYQSAWAKTYLKKIGYINNEVKGYWEITNIGKEIESINFKELEKVLKKKNFSDNFLLKKLLIQENNDDIINVKFMNQEYQNTDFYTLIIGKNTSGKSFLLGQITEIFVYLEKYKRFIKANRLRYDYYSVDYVQGDMNYRVTLDFRLNVVGSPIKIWCDSKEIPFEELYLPKKVVAVSYNLNDRFNSSIKGTNMYFYQGINRFKGQDFVYSIYDSIIKIIRNGEEARLKQILSILGYKFPIKMYFTYQQETQNMTFGIDTEESSILNSEQIILEDSFIKDSKKIQEIEESMKMAKKVSMTLSIENLGDVKGKNLDDLSSGEKQLLFTFLNICSEIEESSLVLIDEPENSLHPTWQTNYLIFIQKLFEKLKLKSHFIFATHSPFLVSNLSELNSSIVISDMKNRQRDYSLLEYSPYAWSIENILYEVFQVETTRNIYVDDDMQTIINYFSEIDEVKPSKNSLIESFIRISKIDNLSASDPLNEFKKNAWNLLKKRTPLIAMEIEKVGYYDEF